MTKITDKQFNVLLIVGFIIFTIIVVGVSSAMYGGSIKNALPQNDPGTIRMVNNVEIELTGIENDPVYPQLKCINLKMSHKGDSSQIIGSASAVSLGQGDMTFPQIIGATTVPLVIDGGEDKDARACYDLNEAQEQDFLLSVLVPEHEGVIWAIPYSDILS